MLNAGLFTSVRGTWRTPRALYDALDREFRFTTDVTPPEPETDSLNALSVAWTGVVYANPPYGKGLYAWLQRAWEEAGKGTTVVMLLPARTDTAWFHEYCLRANEIRFLKGRLHFDDAPNPAPFPSMVVVWRTKKKR